MATGPNFSTQELQCKGRDCGDDGCPINGATQALVDALEAFRATVGKPVLIDSAYRCPHHNGSIAVAVQHSQHVLGNAADIRVIGMTGAQLEAVARIIPAIKGIGRDDFENYIHIDVREIPAEWSYNQAGAEIAYYSPTTILT